MDARIGPDRPKFSELDNRQWHRCRSDPQNGGFKHFTHLTPIHRIGLEPLTVLPVQVPWSPMVSGWCSRPLTTIGTLMRSSGAPPELHFKVTMAVLRTQPSTRSCRMVPKKISPHMKVSALETTKLSTIVVSRLVTTWVQTPLEVDFKATMAVLRTQPSSTIYRMVMKKMIPQYEARRSRNDKDFDHCRCHQTCDNFS